MQNTNSLRLIRCTVAGQVYDLDMSWVRGIQRLDRLQRNKGENGREGWVVASEGQLPVYSLSALLKLPAGQDSPLQRIVVLNSKGGQGWAILVDRVSQPFEIPGNCFFALPAVVMNTPGHCFSSVVRLGDELALMLSVEKLYPEYQAKAQPAANPPSSVPEAALQTSGTRMHSGYNQMIVFSVPSLQAGEHPLSFGMSITQVAEILEPLPLIPVPGAAAYILGLANWRQEPVAVLDLAQRLGLPTQASGSAARFLIANTSAGKIGFPIRPGSRVLRLPVVHHPCTQPPAVDWGLVRSLVELENEVLLVPDLRKM
jgi:purine-binding chemotaxis protein CheW